MLNEFRSTYITWDKATSRIYSPVTANESDENGRKLVVQIVNSGQVEDLTGATLHLYWETRDKLHDGLDVFKAVDLKKGEFELSYTTGMLSNKGVLNANLVLIDTTGRVVSERFKITVTEGIDNDAIQSENSFSSLTQALIDISNLEQNYAPRLNDLTAQLQQTEQELNAQLAQKAQQTDVRRNTDDHPINVSEMDTETKALFTGGAVAIVGEDAVGEENIKNRAVTEKKIRGYRLGQNLFNVDDITPGYYPLYLTGKLAPWEGSASSDFIEVKPNTPYFLSYSHHVAWYDSNKNFISGVQNPVTNVLGMSVTSPSNAAYVRFGLSHNLNGRWEGIQFHEGVEPKPFEPYRFKVKNLESDRLIDVANSSTTVNYNANGTINSMLEIRDNKEIVNNFIYENMVLTKIEEVCDGIKTVETLNFNNGLFEGTTKTVEIGGTN